MASRLRSYLLANTDPLWESLQASPGPVDCLEGCNLEMFDILFDYLATELRIRLPTLSHRTTLGNCTIVSQMTWHEAKVIQTRLARHEISTLSEVMLCYGREFPGMGNMGKEWATFLSRQRTWFTAETQVLTLVVSSDDAWPAVS